MFEKEIPYHAYTNFPVKFDPSEAGMSRSREEPWQWHRKEEYPLNFSQVNVKTVDLTDRLIHKENFENRDLSGLNFRNTEFIQVSFKNTNLSNSNFHSAKFHRVSFENAQLSHARFSLANLSQTDLRGSDFSYANLAHADLRGANLQGANLSHANLRLANFQQADLSKAILPDLTNYDKSTMFKGAIMPDGSVYQENPK